jgi:hypothetical protein
LLARLMPEQRTAGISADGPPKKRPSQQRPFGHPPRAVRGTDLVKTEQHERPQIDQRKQAKGIGEGEEGWEVHAYEIFSVTNSAYEFVPIINVASISLLLLPQSLSGLVIHCAWGGHWRCLLGPTI